MEFCFILLISTVISQGLSEHQSTSPEHLQSNLSLISAHHTVPPEIKKLFSEPGKGNLSLNTKNIQDNRRESDVQDPSSNGTVKVKKFLQPEKGSVLPTPSLDGSGDSKLGFAEGGSILTSKYITPPSTAPSTTSHAPDSSVQYERNNSKNLDNDKPLSLDLSFPHEIEHKNTSTVVARKGVGLPPPAVKQESSHVNTTTSEACECCAESPRPVNCTCCNISSDSSSTVGPSTENTLHARNGTYQKPGNNTYEDNLPDTNATSKPVEQKNGENGTAVTTGPVSISKGKPTATPDHDDGYSSDMQSSLVIPIISIILAVPLVVVLCLFLYKKSQEFWERRHYKRMDFLIDGMYNE